MDQINAPPPPIPYKARTCAALPEDDGGATTDTDVDDNGPTQWVPLEPLQPCADPYLVAAVGRPWLTSVQEQMEDWVRVDVLEAHYLRLLEYLHKAQAALHRVARSTTEEELEENPEVAWVPKDWFTQAQVNDALKELKFHEASMSRENPRAKQGVIHTRISQWMPASPNLQGGLQGAPSRLYSVKKIKLRWQFQFPMEI